MTHRLHRFEENGVVWWLEAEGLEKIIREVVPREAERRPRFVLPYEGGRLFVKCFREEGAIALLRNLFFSRGRKEYEIAVRLRERSVPTPLPLGYGQGRCFSYSVREWVDGRDICADSDTVEQRAGRLSRVAALVRQLASAKVRHNDLHPGNIIFGDAGPCIIDLHKTSFKRFFTRADETSNLSHILFGLYGRLSDGEKDLFFTAYGKPEIRGRVEKEIERFGARWVEQKKKRAFRTTSKLCATEDWVHIKGYEDRGLGQLVSVIKQDRKAVVERHTEHVRKVYAQKGRLKKAWRNHVALEYMELPVTAQAFCMRKPRLGRKGFIAMENLSGKGEQLDVFLDRSYDAMDYSTRLSLVRRFSSFLAALFRKGISHADMKACNVFVLEPGSFRLIDVEDIRFGKVDQATLIRILLQLHLSVPGRVTLKDRLRFLSMVTRGFPFDKRRMLKAIACESLKGDVVYVGVHGTVLERSGEEFPS